MSFFYSMSSGSQSYSSALLSVPLGENPGTENEAQQWLAQNPGATAQDIINWGYDNGGDTYAGAGQFLQQFGIDINQLVANRQAPASSIISGGGQAQAPQGEPGNGSAPANMSLSPAGLQLIEGFEGCSLTAYDDGTGVWTIGYGHTGGVQPGQTITQEQADQYLMQDVAWAEDAVRSQVKVPLTQGQFDALVSFTYNGGPGMLQELVETLNTGDYAGTQAAFGEYVHAGGKVLPGLVTRRQKEADMFGGQGPQGSNPTETPASTPSQAGSYTVKSGDTLSGIAAAYGVSLQSLIDANPQISNPNLIYPGQNINIPGGGSASGTTGGGTASTASSSYTVKSGDTLSGIAAAYGVSLQSLIDANPQISNPNLIYPGQSINIPGGGSVNGTTWTPPSNGSTAGGVQATQKMQELAANSRQVAAELDSVGWCAKGVEIALSRTYGLNIYGDGNDVDEQLEQNGWQRVDMSLEDALKVPGLVLVWEKTSTASGSIYGHTAITQGDGHSSSSDFVENDTLAGSSGRTGLSIWAPPDAVIGSSQSPTPGPSPAPTQNAAQQWLAQNPGATAQDIINWGYDNGGDTYTGAGQFLQQFGIDINQLVANRQAPASSIIGGGSAGDTSGGGTATAASSNYTVQSGDTLSGIAAAYGVSLQSLIDANPQISNPNLIYPGQNINIPGNTYTAYTAKSGPLAGMSPEEAARQGAAAGKTTVSAVNDINAAEEAGGSSKLNRAIAKLNDADAMLQAINAEIESNGGRMTNAEYAYLDAYYGAITDSGHSDEIAKAVGEQFAQGLRNLSKQKTPGSTQNAAQQWLAQNPSATAQDIINWGYDNGGDTYTGAGQFLQQFGIDINQLVANRQAPASGIIGGASSTSSSGSVNPPRSPSNPGSVNPPRSPSNPGDMSLSPAGLQLIEEFEGCSLTAYDDGTGVWTIGYGHTDGVQPGQTITQEQADQYLMQDVGGAEDAVRSQVKVPLTQGQFDALVSFTYNGGPGMLQELVEILNNGDYAGTQAAFGEYVYAGGQVLPGLVTRRQKEADMFGNQGPQGSNPTETPASTPSQAGNSGPLAGISPEDAARQGAAAGKTTVSAVNDINAAEEAGGSSKLNRAIAKLNDADAMLQAINADIESNGGRVIDAEYAYLDYYYQAIADSGHPDEIAKAVGDQFAYGLRNLYVGSEQDVDPDAPSGDKLLGRGGYAGLPQAVRNMSHLAA